jgi:hypothetical protein
MSDKPPYIRVVGVVADVLVASLENNPASVIYHPYRDNPWPRVSVVVRSKFPPRALDAAVRQAVWEVEPGIPVPALKTLGTLGADSVSGRRFDLSLVGLFTAMALLLACVGVYGLLSYSVSRRTSEIGIRRAVGREHGGGRLRGPPPQHGAGLTCGPRPPCDSPAMPVT